MTHFQQGKNSWTSFISIRPKIWSLQHTQGFSKVWGSDLLFDPTWPIFIFVRDFRKTNILTNFHDNLTENVASRVYTRFFERSDLVFDPKWPIFKHDQDFINKNILTKFHDNRTENVASRAYSGVHGHEVEHRPCNHEVPSSSPGSGLNFGIFHWPTHSARVLV